jgi:hypothetical protein
MSVALNDLFLLTLEGTCYNQRIMFTHGYRVNDDGGGAITENAASVALLAQTDVGGAADLTTDYLALLPAAYTLTRAKVQKIAPIRYRYYYTDHAYAGAHASNTQVTNLAATLTVTSRLAGRSEVANKHIGPLPYGATVEASGDITGAYKTLMETFGAHLLGDIAGGIGTLAFRPVIIHRTLDAEGHIIGYTSSDVFQQSISLPVGTMRRRTVGRGI